jgi:hypothetical protein
MSAGLMPAWQQAGWGDEDADGKELSRVRV